MNALEPFMDLEIDWHMTPEDAVTMYLEWGNNDWGAEYPPVRSKSDFSRYFVVDAWEKTPMIRLVERNSERATDLVSFPVPAHLLAHFKEEFGSNKGLYAISDEIRTWLKREMGQDDMHV